MSNWMAEDHRNWHTLANAEGTPASMCPFDCGAAEAEYWAQEQAHAAFLLADEDGQAAGRPPVKCGACREYHHGAAAVRACYELARM